MLTVYGGEFAPFSARYFRAFIHTILTISMACFRDTSESGVVENGRQRADVRGVNTGTKYALGAFGKSLYRSQLGTRTKENGLTSSRKRRSKTETFGLNIDVD
jgi:hypothetical protein